MKQFAFLSIFLIPSLMFSQIKEEKNEGLLYKFGIGYQAFDDNFRNSWLIGIDFTRKRFGFNKQEKLSSVSVFLEFQLF